MTDRELLELAAKAAELDVRWEHWPSTSRGAFYLPNGQSSERHGEGLAQWNPIADDGDALRLAATLGIDIEWRADGRVAAYRHANGYCFTAFESSREDRAANVRRAIVRAAAEIWRAKE